MYFEISNDAVPGDLALPFKDQYKQNLPIALIISSCSTNVPGNIKLVLLVEGEVCITTLRPYKAKTRTNPTLTHIAEF